MRDLNLSSSADNGNINTIDLRKTRLIDDINRANTGINTTFNNTLDLSGSNYLRTVSEPTPKSKFNFKPIQALQNINQKLGEKFFPPKQLSYQELEADINKNLKKGLGIKKDELANKDLSVKFNDNSDTFEIYMKGAEDAEPINTGYISLSRFNDKVQQVQPTFISGLLGKKPITQASFSKQMDFPYDNAQQYKKSALGAEVVAAMNNAIKNKGGKLFSSTSHLDDGSTRYLQEYAKGRMLPGQQFDEVTNQYLTKLKTDLGDNPTKSAIKQWKDENTAFSRGALPSLRWQYPMVAGAIGTAAYNQSQRPQEMYGGRRRYQDGGHTDLTHIYDGSFASLENYAKRTKIKSAKVNGSIFYFTPNGKISSVDDNPQNLQDGGTSTKGVALQNLKDALEDKNAVQQKQLYIVPEYQRQITLSETRPRRGDKGIDYIQEEVESRLYDIEYGTDWKDRQIKAMQNNARQADTNEYLKTANIPIIPNNPAKQAPTYRNGGQFANPFNKTYRRSN